MITDLGLVRDYCRADSADDAVLSVLVEAAEGWASAFLNRQVFATQGELDAAVAAGAAGDQPMLANVRFTAAVLEIVADRYDHREDSAKGSTLTRAQRMLWPDRVGLGV